MFYFINRYRYWLMCIAVVASTLLMHASYAGQVYENRIYDPKVLTVQFYLGDKPLSYPVLDLNKPTQTLTLSFDEMGTKISRFQVSFMHCDAHWQASNLQPLEFYDGYASDPINDATPSRAVQKPYIHYRFTFPQNTAKFRVSGNYILKVFRNNEDELVLTRRFVVVENLIGLQADAGITGNVSKRFQVQSVNFYLFPGSFPILDHQRELEVVILQNFRWDNARYGLKPTYMYPDKFEYRFEAANDFEGGNEYRLIDCRNIRQQGLGVSRFHYDDSVTTVELLPERIRTSNTYRTDPDLNGNFFTGIRGMPGAGAADVDYVNVRFSLEMAEPLVDSVFIFGALSDWRLDPRFLMRWNRGYYTADVLLKQGVYNYHYVVAENGKPDETRLEGSHFETENYYTILVYYKGPIDRTHRLIGFRHLNYYD